MSIENIQQPPQSEQFLLEGRRYAPYMIHDPGTRPNGQTIALFHGISMPHTHWGELPDELGDLGYRTVAIGLAEKTHGLIPTLGNYARDAATVMDGVIGEPAHLLGLSWGGALVQQIAMDHPDKVRRVIAAATLPAAPLPALGIPDYKAALAIASPHRSAKAMGNIYGGDFRNNPELAEEYTDIFERPIDAASHTKQQVALAWSSSLAWRRVIQRVAGTEHPETTFLYGDDDPIIPHRQVEAGARILGSKAIRILNGGHGFLLTRPHESAALIDNILSQDG